MKVILVTGTSSGIGREAVHHLAKAGAHVVATARNLADIKDLEAANVDIMELDVTREESMQNAVQATLDKHGRIDGLVNNAGFGVYLPQETTPMDTLRHMYEVNVFGLHRLTQIVLPHMRAAGSGRIVNVSSVAGHVTIPCLGSYCATKHAVRAMSGALWSEVKPHGLSVSLIEPGVINTSFGERAKKETATVIDATGPYAKAEKFINKQVNMQKGRHPRVIASAIRHACLAKRPKFRYTRPIDARAGKLVSKFLPDALWHRAVVAVIGEKPKKAS